jgi:hypothetical protein
MSPPWDQRDARAGGAGAGLADRAHDVGAEPPPVDAVARQRDEVIALGLVALDPVSRGKAAKAVGDRQQVIEECLARPDRRPGLEQEFLLDAAKRSRGVHVPGPKAIEQPARELQPAAPVGVEPYETCRRRVGDRAAQRRVGQHPPLQHLEDDDDRVLGVGRECGGEVPGGGGEFALFGMDLGKIARPFHHRPGLIAIAAR